MGRPARLRRKLRRAEHFATLAADVAALAGNAKSGARLVPAQRGRTGASPAAENTAYEGRCPGGRRMGASPTAVKAARGVEHAPKERRAGASYVAENAAATGVVAHAMQEGTFVTVLISGEAWPAVFTGGVVHVMPRIWHSRPTRQHLPPRSQSARPASTCAFISLVDPYR